MLKTILKYFIKWIKGEIPRVDAWYFIQGHCRQTLYYSYPALLRKHIKEQIEWRMLVVDKECWNSGQCKICGCSQPALLMCDKPCDKPCYFPMLNKGEWKFFKQFKAVIKKGYYYSYNPKTQTIKTEQLYVE